MRRLLLASLLLASVACSGGIPGLSPAAPDSGPTTFFVDTGAGDKALLYNLVGRWYPEGEIKRLSDRTLTPEQWCEREPDLIFVYPEKVEVRCRDSFHSAMIAGVTREKDGSIHTTFRVKEGSALKHLAFEVHGPKAKIMGSPCGDKAPGYARFPEFEILGREVLAGRRCAQVGAAAVLPK